MQVFFSVFDQMRERLGPILVQLPERVSFNAGVAETFYSLLATTYRQYDFSLEVTAPHIYLRFHGPGYLYASSYATVSLRAYARKCKRWLEEGHDLWIFFNNDVHGYALQNAEKLKELFSLL